EDGIRYFHVTGVQTCALPISRTWFFKMTGDSTLVGNQTPAFDAFIASVHFTESAPASAPAAPATVATGPLTWTAPAGWQPKDLEIGRASCRERGARRAAAGPC